MIRVCIDFDGTLYTPSASDTIARLCGKPTAGALAFVSWLLERGVSVVILSARGNSYETTRVAAEWLATWGFPPLPFTAIKPEAVLYVDDRAFRFVGQWDGPQSIVAKLLEEDLDAVCQPPQASPV